MAFTSQDTVVFVEGVTVEKEIELKADKATLKGARGDVMVGHHNFSQLPVSMKHDLTEDAMKAPAGPIQFTMYGVTTEGVEALRAPMTAFKIKALNLSV